mmetsp:Transcript_21864/g.85676  ORF Transcript_21864/g.85676 Transcript_21864/m.85676 type:complete len:260 (-) Transcript_21864:3857-4636(-)
MVASCLRSIFWLCRSSTHLAMTCEGLAPSTRTFAPKEADSCATHRSSCGDSSMSTYISASRGHRAPFRASTSSRTFSNAQSWLSTVEPRWSTSREEQPASLQILSNDRLCSLVVIMRAISLRCCALASFSTEPKNWSAPTVVRRREFVLLPLSSTSLSVPASASHGLQNVSDRQESTSRMRLIMKTSTMSGWRTDERILNTSFALSSRTSLPISSSCFLSSASLNPCSAARFLRAMSAAKRVGWCVEERRWTRALRQSL